MTKQNDDEPDVPSTERAPTATPIEASAPEEFGLVQAWWGDGKGKTTAAIGMGVRAAGHGYRVHMVQFMKGGTSTVEDVRGEYNALEYVPGFTYENTGHYGWHGFLDGSGDDEHLAQAKAGLARAREWSAGAAEADLTTPIPLDGSPADGVHMLILDEILYAVSRDLIAEADVVDLVESKAPDLELVLTGGHQEPEFLTAHADLLTQVRKVKHPIDAGHAARKGTEY